MNQAYKDDPQKKKDRINQAYQDDPQSQRDRKNQAYRKNPLKERDRKKQAHNKKVESEIKHNFFTKQAEGLSYPCCSCHRLLFKTSVVPFEKDDPENEVVKSINDNDLDHCVTIDEEFKCEDRFWLCHNCKNNLKDGKMPNMCHSNALDINTFPEELADLTNIELMMIKKKLVFIRLMEKKSSLMKYMTRNIVNVPISDSDIIKSVSYLPRTGNNLGMVNVAFKRERKRFYYRKPELIRPSKVNEALLYLKSKHPSYKDFDIEYINNPNKYMFCHLPLIGQLLEDEENLSTLDDAYDFLKSSELLTEILCPLGKRNDESYGLLMENLIRARAPQDKNSFIHALRDQIR